MAKEEKEKTAFAARDVRLLRERLVWTMKHSPLPVAEQINKTLLAFAKNIQEYCKCEDTVYINKEMAYACLNCGSRHTLKKDVAKIEK